MFVAYEVIFLMCVSCYHNLSYISCDVDYNTTEAKTHVYCWFIKLH